MVNNNNMKYKRNSKRKTERTDFPKEFPFWARIKVTKNNPKRRPTLVIDEELKNDDLNFVHRRVTSKQRKGKNDREEIKINPNKNRKDSMFLRRAEKNPIKDFEPNNTKMKIPEELVSRYNVNNKK